MTITIVVEEGGMAATTRAIKVVMDAPISPITSKTLIVMNKMQCIRVQSKAVLLVLSG